MTNSIVIVGAGLAGVRAAIAARGAGHEGRIILLSAENAVPYDRPPLSKGVLMDSGAESMIALEPAQTFVDKSIELQLGLRAIHVDRQQNVVRCKGGNDQPYSRLVLATGSRVRVFGPLPIGSPNVFYLRTLKDARSLRSSLKPGARVAIVGGGVIGMEVAAVAASKELKVTVLEAGPRILGRGASPAVAAAMASVHESRGVAIRCGVAIREVNTSNSGYRFLLEDGTQLEADVVVVGIGVTPRTELAAQAGLHTTAAGIVVDGSGRSSDPSIFAAGECAFHFNALSGKHERHENWMHAAAHGQHVGRSLCSAQPDYREPCSYWSDQYDRTLQVFGSPLGTVEVMRGDPASGSFLCFHVDEGRVVGVSAMNAPREFRKARALVLAGAIADETVLSDLAADFSALKTAALV